MEGAKLMEELKRLQKIHCRTCNADYEVCQGCAFHMAVNRILNGIANEQCLKVRVLPPETQELLACRKTSVS